jgi:hypothetical protein
MQGPNFYPLNMCKTLNLETYNLCIAYMELLLGLQKINMKWRENLKQRSLKSGFHCIKRFYNFLLYTALHIISSHILEYLQFIKQMVMRMKWCKLVYTKLKRERWHIPQIKVSNNYSNLYLNLFTGYFQGREHKFQFHIQRCYQNYICWKGRKSYT